MKIKTISLGFFALLFSMTIMVSCGEAKKESKEVAEEEVTKESEESKELHEAHLEYQCPMDCEHGKTYHEAGSCPVCKMDLKAVNAGGSMTCKQHEDGNCTCEGEKCKCENCKEHS